MFNAAEIAYMDEMIAFYHDTAFTDCYMMGFENNGNLYNVTLKWDEFRAALKYDRAAASKGGMLKIRVKPAAALLNKWARRAVKVGIAAELTEDKKHNRGENYERIITEKLCGEQWEKDSIPYTDAGDVIYNGVSYQVKFFGAELTNAKTYENMKKSLA